jgi:ABC-type uncharacterized transport system involved in gliding motility auxiliary subunit
MSTEDNSKQKTKYASNALLSAFFVIGAIVLVNLVSTRIFGRIDLTENRIYTLSQPSKDLVKNLPDYFSVKAFMSSDLPPELMTVSRYVRDLIDEYKTSSNGKFTWNAIDPGQDKKLEEEASRCHVQKLQIQVLRSQKFELGSYYLGLCLEYNGKTESIPQVARPEGLEYQVSSLIKQLTTKKRKVAFTTGHGEAEINQGFQSMKEDLSHEFDTTTVNPSSAEIGDDVDALVIGGPKQALDDKAQREIDKFLMKGKGAVMLVDGMAMTSPGGGGMGMEQMAQVKMGQANETGLGTILGAYGFKVGQDFVFDKQAANGPVDMGGRKMLMTLPVFVGAEVDQVKDLTVLAGVKGAVFPYASSVALTGPLSSGKPEKGKLWRLAASSKQSWKETGFFILGPTTKFDDTSKEKGPFSLGYAYEGPLKSAFAPVGAPAAATSDPAAPASESKKAVRLVVIGDSDFANDEYVQLARFLPYYSAGVQLLFNAISWTIEDEQLTPLRSKTLIPRPITVSSEAKAAALQWGNILGLPVAFCLFGVVRWRIRRANRLGQKL